MNPHETLMTVIALFGPVTVLLNVAYNRTYGAGKQDRRLADMERGIEDNASDNRTTNASVTAIEKTVTNISETLRVQAHINSAQDKINDKFDKLQSDFNRMVGREQRRDERDERER